jgi:hypothetical protein
MLRKLTEEIASFFSSTSTALDCAVICEHDGKAARTPSYWLVISAKSSADRRALLASHTGPTKGWHANEIKTQEN